MLLFYQSNIKSLLYYYNLTLIYLISSTMNLIKLTLRHYYTLLEIALSSILTTNQIENPNFCMTLLHRQTYLIHKLNNLII